MFESLIFANISLPADKKTIEIKKSKGDDSDSDARPKKKASAKASAKGSGKGHAKAPTKAPTKAHTKTNGKAAVNGKKSSGKR
jgi:hypothetical protein